mmetsp:Transcript_11486/g.29395  ORF Transcript_11486/g.29395 Transcript_11486/m.29395 type:complete len:206 (-) Transcript_11486:1958-2575(-)
MIRRIPRRYAASTFEVTPPTGSTVPVSVTSPVMAVSLRHIRPVSTEVNAVTSVTPADGPSFPTAPSGKWMCRSMPSIKLAPSSRLAITPSSCACDRIHPRAMCADSLITSPSDPVSLTFPVPLILVASTNSTEPPIALAARPIAMPADTTRDLGSSPTSKMGAPRISTSLSSLITIWSCRADAADAADAGPSEPNCPDSTILTAA